MGGRVRVVSAGRVSYHPHPHTRTHTGTGTSGGGRRRGGLGLRAAVSQRGQGPGGEGGGGWGGRVGGGACRKKETGDATNSFPFPPSLPSSMHAPTSHDKRRDRFIHANE